MRIIISILLLASACSALSLSPANLRCEYAVNPLGVESARPRLSWTLESTVPGDFQSAYQVIAGSWNSGKVNSRQTAQIRYGGKPLGSGETAPWKVRVWDKNGRPSAWSVSARWTMGLLQESDWSAQWIGWKSERLPIFRKEFRAGRALKRATVFICGLGHFELHLNGRVVGDHVLDPGWTNYRKTALYVTHDVTGMVQSGANALGVMLGNGMYNVPGGRYVKFKGSFGLPKFIVQLRLHYADGSVETVASDSTWKAAGGPIVFSCVFGGEDHDARLEPPGWDTSGFDDSSWTAANVMEGPGGRLSAQIAPPIRVMRTFRAVKVTKPRPGIKVYDLGQNFSGRPVLTARGPSGAAVKMIPGELLNPDGTVSQRSSGGPSFFTYTLRGGGMENWRPRFSYYGFRYVQVEADSTAEVLNVGGEFIHSSAPPAGEFATSNQMINRIHELIQYAIRSNLQSVLTDCPHREKLGWLEVAQLLGPSLLYSYDLQTFYTKVAGDMRDSQHEDGVVPTTAPEFTVFKPAFRDSPEWGSASIIIPWLLYQRSGDQETLRESYPMMTRYADYLTSRAKENIVAFGLGDWYDIGPGRPGGAKLTPPEVTGTATYYQDLTTVRDAALPLGRMEDHARYKALAESVAHTFDERFYRPEEGYYHRGSQAANAMALVTGIAPSQRAAALVEKIVADIRSRGNHTSAGDVGYRYVVRALTDAQRSDVLFDMATRTDPPSYGSQIEKGATSLTEAWDADPRSSQNHCMLGHIEEWFYTGLAGINFDATAPEGRKIVIRPQPAGDLTWVKAHYDSIYGKISSEWRSANGAFTLTVRIPPNQTATVCLPGEASGIKVESGEHRFSVRVR